MVVARTGRISIDMCTDTTGLSILFRVYDNAFSSSVSGLVHCDIGVCRLLHYLLPWGDWRRKTRVRVFYRPFSKHRVGLSRVAALPLCGHFEQYGISELL